MQLQLLQLFPTDNIPHNIHGIKESTFLMLPQNVREEVALYYLIL